MRSGGKWDVVSVTRPTQKNSGLESKKKKQKCNWHTYKIKIINLKTTVLTL
jgi:hypothetical protein